MSDKITLKIVPFENPSGAIAHRVTGRVLGRKVERNFASRELAQGFLDELVAAAQEGESAPKRRTAHTTFQNDTELRVAELAHQRLKAAAPDASLLVAVDHFIATRTRTILHLDANEAVEAFLAQRLGRGNQQKTADVTGSVLRKWIREEKITSTRAMTPLKASSFIYDTSVAVRTRRDRYDLLHNFSEFLISKNHLAEHLTQGQKRPIVTSEGEVSILTVEKCQRLLDAAATEPCGRRGVRGAMLPYFATCLLSGTRPDEAKRMRPDWGNYSFANNVITGFRAKTKKSRTIEMHDELPEILRACKTAGLPAGYFSRKAFERIQRAAGVRVGAGNTEWDNDILRHCYASYSYAAYKNKGTLIKDMGNSEEVLDASYLNLTVLKEDGGSFLKIKPRDLSQLGLAIGRAAVDSSAR